MITGELKNKIDSLWDVFAAGGLVNPLDVIEQMQEVRTDRSDRPYEDIKIIKASVIA